MFGGKAAVRDDLIELGKIGYVNHRFSANFVWSATMTTRCAHFIMARIDSTTSELVSLRPSAVMPRIPRMATSRDAMEHAFADGPN